MILEGISVESLAIGYTTSGRRVKQQLQLKEFGPWCGICEEVSPYNYNAAKKVRNSKSHRFMSYFRRGNWGLGNRLVWIHSHFEKGFPLPDLNTVVESRNTKLGLRSGICSTLYKVASSASGTSTLQRSCWSGAVATVTSNLFCMYGDPKQLFEMGWPSARMCGCVRFQWPDIWNTLLLNIIDVLFPLVGWFIEGFVYQFTPNYNRW